MLWLLHFSTPLAVVTEIENLGVLAQTLVFCRWRSAVELLLETLQVTASMLVAVRGHPAEQAVLSVQEGVQIVVSPRWLHSVDSGEEVQIHVSPETI